MEKNIFRSVLIILLLMASACVLTHTDKQAISNNARKPANEAELQYWLRNMVCYHHFTNEEIVAATGLTEEAVVNALNKFDIHPLNRPKRLSGEPLCIMPYPGGRHPRIGFLEGAINPQRETKFSAFTPWDDDSYVVVDVPEAIQSNLGLIYLAHTHVPTIWTDKGISLQRLEWKYPAGNALYCQRKLPNGIIFGRKVTSRPEAIEMDLWLTNGTGQKLTGLKTQVCIMLKMAKGFESQTNNNKIFESPFAACQSDDQKRWIITAWEDCQRVWGNEKCPCLHSDPQFPDCNPGETKRLHGILLFYEGSDLDSAFQKIKKDSSLNL